MKHTAGLFISLAFLASCTDKTEQTETVITPQDTVYTVTADVETAPVKSALDEDAADDPAIWINSADPEKSTIIGTNKKLGLGVYNFKGEELFFYTIGNVNNVDVRYKFNLNGEPVDLVAASNRSSNTISLLKINQSDGSLEEIAARELKSNVDEVYGLCMYHDKKADKHYVFVNGKAGAIEQWELKATDGGKIDGEIVRTLSVDSQPEGMVADDIQGTLYVGEEDKGVWKFSAKADADTAKTFIAMSDTTNKNIEYDVEGISLYYNGDEKGYLIISSQGNHTYAVFERSGDNKYLGSFSVKDGSIDGSEETDGIDVTNIAIVKTFPNGVFIAQDGYNFNGDSVSTQNFKAVSWDKIANAFSPQLEINPSYSAY